MCERQNVHKVSLTLGSQESERDPENERDQRSKLADFLSAPDSSLTDSHFTAQAWNSKVSLLTVNLFTNAETSERDW